jgi:hypothetical protein
MGPTCMHQVARTAPDRRCSPRAQTSPTYVLDRYEIALLEYGVWWSRFGGGRSEDIFEEFGSTECAHFQRLLTLTSLETRPPLNDFVRKRIRQVCHQRLTATCGPTFEKANAQPTQLAATPCDAREEYTTFFRRFRNDHT